MNHLSLCNIIRFRCKATAIALMKAKKTTLKKMSSAGLRKISCATEVLLRSDSASRR